MRNTLINCVAFAVGAAVGSAVTWKLVKTKYERIAQEEIDSVKETFSDKQSEPVMGDTEDGITEEPIVGQIDIREYAEKLHDMNYVDYSNSSRPDVMANKKAERANVPYVISPDEFAELKEYETVSLTYYKEDKVLTYENDEIVEDVDALVGRESLNHFGEYEDDSVFVRDDELKRDYEILLDQRKFTDVVNKHPHKAEG